MALCYRTCHMTHVGTKRFCPITVYLNIILGITDEKADVKVKTNS